MNRRIAVLSDELVQKIAAGEVIDSPASIVKELVENSIDAGSSTISIHLIEGGIESIKVIDDGHGIHTDDLRLAITRYATSKISSESDFSSISSLGFRGEALASICSVTNFTIISQSSANRSSRLIKCEYGKITTDEEYRPIRGTTIIAEKLFENFPARKKFLRSSKSEMLKCKSIVERLSVSYPNIMFVLYSNGREALRTYGKNDIKNTFDRFFGEGYYDSSIKLSSKLNGVSLTGYASNRFFFKNSRSFQIFLVNGRLIENKSFYFLIREVYSDIINKGYHPAVIVMIELDPSLVDSNVHPRKEEVKFFQENKFLGTLRILLEKCIKHVFHVDDVSTNPMIRDNCEKTESPVLLDGILERDKNEIDDFILRENIDQQRVWSYTVSSDEQTSVSENVVQGEISSSEVLIVRKLLHSKYQKNCVFFGTYISFQFDDSLLIIDQHAAHERIMYEKLKKELDSSGIANQLLIEPIFMLLNTKEMMAFKEVESFLNRSGYEVTEFGENQIRIDSVPSIIGSLDVKNIKSSISDFLEYSSSRNSQEIYDYIITKSCKNSIKANRVLNKEEIDELISMLVQCENPFNCPHGRPVVVEVKKQDFEKLFRRIV